MDNLIFYNPKDHRDRCHCGALTFVSAIYLERANTGEWHVMIEEQCPDCGALDLTDVPLDDAARQFDAPKVANQDTDDPALGAFFANLAEMDDDR